MAVVPTSQIDPGVNRRLLLVGDRAAAGRVVADHIELAMSARRPPVVGLATGSSPLDGYHELIRRHAVSPRPVERVWWALVDEYVGLPVGHPQRYRHVIQRDLLDGLGVPADRLLVPDVDAADLDVACRQYEARVADLGGADLQVLGIGVNGHLGFNEPGTPFDSRTHLVALHERTRADNARFFERPDEVPTHAITQGLATLHEARRIVLVALGEAKAVAVEAALVGPLDPACPASSLRAHPDVTVVVDPAARGSWSTPDGWTEEIVA